MIKRVLSLAALTIAGLMATHTVAAAEDWPDSPITLIVPWAAGGSTDTLARILQEELESQLDATIVIENRAGAGGTIGSLFVSRSKPDGYTFLLGVSGDQIIAEYLYPELNYSPSKDLVPVGLVAQESLIISARPELAADNCQDWVKMAADEDTTFGTSGVGSTGHLAGEMINRIAGTKMQAIPYKGGAPAVIDTIGERLDTVIVSPIAVTQQIRAGQLKGLATTANQRLDTLPDIPTLKECGVDLDVYTWYMLVTTAGTDQDIIKSMNQALNNALNKEEVQKKIRELGAEPTSGTTAELAELMAAERQQWHELIKAQNISRD